MAGGGGDIGAIFVIQDTVDNLPVRQCQLHRGETKAIQSIGGSGEYGVGGGVIRRKGVTEQVIEKADKHGIREKSDICIIQIRGVVIWPARQRIRGD
jgi:hypothetical protein